MSKILQDYYESKTALEILQKEVDELKAKVVEELKAAPDQKMETGLASFRLQTNYTYQYSVKVTKLAEEVKTLKKEEEVSGTAKVVSETTYPIMKSLTAKGGEIKNAIR